MGGPPAGLGPAAYKGGPAPWLGRLGKVLLVRLVKNVAVFVVVFVRQCANAIYWEVLTRSVVVNDKRKVSRLLSLLDIG